MSLRRQRSNLVPSIMRARNYSCPDNCPTLRVSSTWYSGWNRQDMVLVCPGAMFLMICRGPYLPICEVQIYLRQLVFPSLSGKSLGPLSYKPLRRWPGHRFFWSLSSEFSDQLPDHIQQQKRFCNLGGSLHFLELAMAVAPCVFLP